METKYSIALVSDKKKLLKDFSSLAEEDFKIKTNVYQDKNSGSYFLLCNSEDYVTIVLYMHFLNHAYQCAPSEIMWVTPSGKYIDVANDNFCRSAYDYSLEIGCCAVEKIHLYQDIYRVKQNPANYQKNPYVDVFHNYSRSWKLDEVCDYIKNKFNFNVRVNHRRSTIQIKSNQYFSLLESLKKMSRFAFPEFTDLILPTGQKSNYIENMKLKDYIKADINSYTAEYINTEKIEKQNKEEQTEQNQKTL